MISSVNSQARVLQQSPQTLSQAQGQQLNEVLSNYDADTLTDEDAKSLASQIKDPGIALGSGLASALREADINTMELGEQASVGGPRGEGGPPLPASNGRDSVDETIALLIEEAVEAVQTADEADTLWTVLEPALPEYRL